MCYERRRAEACVDESAHHALVNAGGREIVFIRSKIFFVFLAPNTEPRRLPAPCEGCFGAGRGECHPERENFQIGPISHFFVGAIRKE